MSFSSLIAALDAVVTTTFQRTDPVTDSPVQLLVHFASGAPDLYVPVIVKNPALEEDYVPGAPNAEGVSNILLFVPSSVSTLIPRGSTASYAGSDYDIYNTAVDREGGQTLKLRKRVDRWDQ